MKIIPDMSNADYHAHSALGSSSIKAAAKSLAHWKGQSFSGGTHFDIGTGFHDMVLEGGNNTICGPETRRGKAWGEAYDDALTQGKVLLTEQDYAMCEAMAKSCLSNPRVEAIVRHPEAMIEQSIFVTCPKTGLELKCRPDAYLREKQVCLDLKSTTDAGPGDRDFPSHIWRYKYDLQGAFYSYVLRLAELPITYFAFAAVEKTPPYAQCLHVLSGTVMEHAHKRLMNILRRIAQAVEEDHYPTDWPELNMVHLPAYMEENNDAHS